MIDTNYLRRLIASGQLRPEDLSAMTISGSSESPNSIRDLMEEMPQPRYDIAPMQQNTMRIETGPEAGKVVPMDFRKQQNQQQNWRMKVAGYGGGTVSDLGYEDSAPPELDYSRPGLEIAGLGKGTYGKDGKLYIKTPDGLTKVVLGYDREGSARINKQEQERRFREAQIDQTKKQTELLGAPNYQLTSEGDVFNPKTGEIKAQGVQPAKAQRQREQADYAAGLKELQKDDAAVAGAMQLEQAYREWLELNQRVETGPITGRRPVSFNPDYQRLKQLENFLAVNNFKPGQGQISNFERELIKGSGPNTTNDREANEAIVKIGLGAVQNMKDRTNFREQYLRARGSLLGSDQAWQKYLDDNPRFTRDKSGAIVENAGRVDWKAYFGGGAKQSTEDLPDPRKHAGKVMTDTATGTRYRSDGTRWERIQ